MFKVLDVDGKSRFIEAFHKDMLVDGSIFGFPTGAYCYIPIFRSQVSNIAYKNTWFVGSMFMNNYVTIYDNTGSNTDSGGNPIPVIGLGKKNFDCVRCGVQE